MHRPRIGRTGGLRDLGLVEIDHLDRPDRQVHGRRRGDLHRHDRAREHIDRCRHDQAHRGARQAQGKLLLRGEEVVQLQQPEDGHQVGGVFIDLDALERTINTEPLSNRVQVPMRNLHAPGPDLAPRCA